MSRARSRSGIAFIVFSLAMTAALARPAGVSNERSPSIDPALFGARGLVGLIVQKVSETDRAPERLVATVGGTITRDLPIVRGFAATVPADSIGALARLSAVRVLSLDRSVGFFAAPDSASLKSVYPKVVKADAMWGSGYTGSGVTVALVDTGIADVPDLAGRVLPVTDDLRGTTDSCVNFSGEAGCADSYGHGTFIAGVIAGNGAASSGAWKGVAPGANLVSVKIAGANGAADVSNVLAAIQWVVSFKDRYGIRVLNLSLGTDSTQSYRTDPLNYAVERAWEAGIVVVVSASNRGPDPQTISKPGDDPWVITVGAIDDRATNGLGDDTVPNFSSRGPTSADGIAKPDVVAPGAHIISLCAPCSEIDTRFSNYVDGSYR
jgi:serine protease AprX